jgi:hypothetical protein
MKARSLIPGALSEGEETFALHMKARGLRFVREFQFHPERKWRFDFAFVKVETILGNPMVQREIKVGVEIEGGTRSHGRHTRGAGFESDVEKYNAAALLGWIVLRYTTAMVRSGLADRQVAELLGAQV